MNRDRMQMKPQYPIPDDVLNIIDNLLSKSTGSELEKQTALRIAAFAYNAGTNAGIHSALVQLEETELFIQTLTEQCEEIAL
ncbi:MAG TPA: hypothetical protein VMU30_00765 [Bacteroidota bacterium]|nr:hypothetical protein [Bacteroidota bacterium]